MGNISETGHAVNIANFKKGIDYCDSLGSDYNPSNNDLKVGDMTARWNTAKGIQGQLNSVLIATKGPINERDILFAPLSKLITSCLKHLNSTKASKKIKEDAKGIADALRGRNPKPKHLADGSLNPDFVSTSHLSYVMKADNMQKFIELLTSEPLYAPNETEIQTNTLNNMWNNMVTANDNIGTIIAPLANIRIDRNKELYDENTGIWEVFKNCKSYISGKYGATSAQAKYMNALKFKKYKS